MELTILGSGTAIPVPHRGAPGYLLRAGGVNVLLDPGPGALRRAAAAGVGAHEIDAVFITHFHPDHSLDLPALLFVRRSPGLARTGRPLTIVAPLGYDEILDSWLRGPQGVWLRPQGYELATRWIAPGEHHVAGLGLTAVHVEHTPQSLAYRFRRSKDGPVLAYSGDTPLCEGAVRAGRGADLYLLECARPDSSPWEGHLTPSGAAEVAARAAPRRLVLTHFYPEVEGEPIVETVRKRYPGEIHLAEDGAVFAV